MSAPYRQVFFFEVAPEHWVSVNMKGDFDSDVWLALKAFLDRHETRPIEATPKFQANGEPWNHAPGSVNIEHL
jgi:hypothetical protein